MTLGDTSWDIASVVRRIMHSHYEFLAYCTTSSKSPLDTNLIVRWTPPSLGM